PSATPPSSPAPPPSLALLVPYTPLFRSLRIFDSWYDPDAPNVDGVVGRARPIAELRQELRAGRIDPFALADRCGRPSTPGAAPRDRTSTRLNSRHVSSSYAVFCLKKTKH